MAPITHTTPLAQGSRHQALAESMCVTKNNNDVTVKLNTVNK